MAKKLPRVFANPQEKAFNNNERIYYSKEKNNNELLSNEENNKEEFLRIEDKNIYQKLNEIFSSERYVYKADVEIITRDGKVKTKIIGQNRTHIITMDNQLIPISDIHDIKFTE